jgi:hypothetical protein
MGPRSRRPSCGSPVGRPIRSPSIEPLEAAPPIPPRPRCSLPGGVLLSSRTPAFHEGSPRMAAVWKPSSLPGRQYVAAARRPRPTMSADHRAARRPASRACCTPPPGRRVNRALPMRARPNVSCSKVGGAGGLASHHPRTTPPASTVAVTIAGSSLRRRDDGAGPRGLTGPVVSRSCGRSVQVAARTETAPLCSSRAPSATRQPSQAAALSVSGSAGSRAGRRPSCPRSNRA